MEEYNEKQTPKEPAPPNSPHDRFCKTVLKRPNYARELLKATLPSNLLKQLDLASLRLSDTDRVNTNLEEDFTDIQFNCENVAGGKVEIPVIIEHKSYRPQYGPYQYMNYQNGTWGWQIKTEGEYPTPIIPLVFYHGIDDWQPKPWKDYLKGWDNAFAPFTPPGGCIFVSLSSMPDEKIKQFKFGFMVAAFLLMKHRFERDYLLEHLAEIFTFVEADLSEINIDTKINNLKYALRYLQGLKVIKWQEAKSQLRPLNLTFNVMDVLEEVKQEGLQEGIEIGIEKGIEKGMEKGMEKKDYITCYNMLKQGFPVNTIAEVSEVPEEFVLQVKKQMERQSQAVKMISEAKLDDGQIAAQLSVSPFLVEIWKRGLTKK